MRKRWASCFTKCLQNPAWHVWFGPSCEDEWTQTASEYNRNMRELHAFASMVHVPLLEVRWLTKVTFTTLCCESETLDYVHTVSVPSFYTLSTFERKIIIINTVSSGSLCLAPVFKWLHSFSRQLKAKSISYHFSSRKTVVSVGRAAQVERNTPLNGLFMAVRKLRSTVSKVYANSLIPNETLTLQVALCIWDSGGWIETLIAFDWVIDAEKLHVPAGARLN